jgi:hypothetical protein
MTVASGMDVSTAIPIISAACTWAVDDDLTTLFASPGFARLVGINRLVVAGLPWFAIVRGTSAPALEWLVDTPRRRASAIIELRHLEGGFLPTVAYRVYGGPGKDKVVFRVFPLSRPESTDLQLSLIRNHA